MGYSACNTRGSSNVTPLHRGRPNRLEMAKNWEPGGQLPLRRGAVEVLMKAKLVHPCLSGEA